MAQASVTPATPPTCGAVAWNHQRKNIFMAVTLKHEYTVGKAVSIKCVNICFAQCLVYSKCHISPPMCQGVCFASFPATLGDAEQHSLSFTGKETVAQRLKRLSMVGQQAELPGDAGLQPTSLCMSIALYTASGHGPLYFNRVSKHVSGV